MFAAFCSALFSLDFVTNRGSFVKDGSLRILSCTSAFAVMVVDFIVSGRRLPVLDFCACLALGNSFLLIHPPSFEPMKRPAVCIFSALAVSLVVISPFAGIPGTVPNSAILAVVALLLMTVCLVHSATDRFSSLNLLIRRSGVTQPKADVQRLVYSLVLSQLVSLLLVAGQLPEPWTMWAGECVALFLLVLMSSQYYLCCTGRQFLSGRKTIRVGRALSDSVKETSDGKEDGGLSVEAMYMKILDYMEENKPYLDEKFTLADMAAAIGTNKAYVSRTVNTMYGNNFCQFVNYHRIQYAADLMRKDRRLKVLDVSIMSGFHSVASFNMAFKLYMNDLPSEFSRSFHSKSLSIPVEPGQ